MLGLDKLDKDNWHLSFEVVPDFDEN